MASLFEKSKEYFPRELDLFEEPAINATYQKIQYIECRPTSQLNEGGPLEFVIPPTASQYIDLKRSRLHVKA